MEKKTRNLKRIPSLDLKKMINRKQENAAVEDALVDGIGEVVAITVDGAVMVEWAAGVAMVDGAVMAAGEVMDGAMEDMHH